MNIDEYIKTKLKAQKSPKITPQNVLNTYQNMSESDLHDELLKNADLAKQSGALSNEMLDNFYSNARTLLTPEQAAKLRSLIEELKR